MHGVTNLLQSIARDLTPPIGTNRLSAAPFNFCANNPQQCAYWKCIVDNIKNSKEIESLKSATKILTDPELRHAFATTPELQEAACDIHGPDGFQCQIFRSLLKITDGLAPKTKTLKPSGRNHIRTKREDREEFNSSPDFEDVPLDRAVRDIYTDYYDGKVATKYSAAYAAVPARSQTRRMRDCDAILTGKAYYPQYVPNLHVSQPQQRRLQQQRNRKLRSGRSKSAARN
ncbi:unnamed protein product [Soboliphyme baturini]|uniref:Uncharacterized protein n=1 Tax=Soboliphyme baturini TaxID=241478 RepID=A0A183IZQ8_9BILA|nr:unnamed protein product [Soboliphyme baturini]